MKSDHNLLKFVVVFVCLLALASIVVFAQSDGGGKTWDDAVKLFNQAKAAYKQARFHDAIVLYEKALVIVRELDERYAEGVILGNLGNCYRSLSDYQKATDYHEQSLAVARYIGDRADEANSLMGLGVCYYSLSEYQKAIDYYKQSLVIFRDIGDRADEANSLMGLGNCYWALSAYQKAIDYHKQSLVIFRDIGDRAGEAASLNNLGLCYDFLSDYQRAIDYHEQSLAIARDIGDRIGEAASLGNLGLCYDFLSDYQKAIDYHEQSLAIKREIGDRAGEARSLNNLGVCYYSLSDYQKAIDYFEQSLEIKRHIGDRAGEANSLVGLGICYDSLSDYQKAIDYYKQSLAIERNIDDRAGEANSLGNLGNCYQSLSEHQKAIEYYDQALALSEELGARETERLIHWGLGRTYRAMKEPKTALTHYKAAIEIVESIRGKVSEEKLRKAYFGSVRTLYEEYLKLLLEMGRNEETVLVAERLRARTFLDGLYQAGLDPEQLQVSEAGIAPSGDTTAPVVDANALDQAVKEAQASLLPNEAALEYMVTDDGIYLWIVTAEGRLGPQFIPYDREQLLRDVVALRRAIEPETKKNAAGVKIIFSDPSESLKHFYELLVQPALSQLADGVDTLIIIPSGPLWYVPFSALMMTDRSDVEFGSPGPGGTKQYRPRYLIDDYTLAFLPSLASLPMLIKERAPSTANYLAFANPTLSKEDEKSFTTPYQFPMLEQACQSFAECLGKGEEKVYVKGDAQEERAYDEAAGNEVLVYACHGIFNPSVPLDSRLLLAPSKEQNLESTDRRLPDGDYHASEVILSDNKGVDLVILAACETLLPTLREVQGALGMTLGPESDKKLNLGQLELIVAGDEVVGLSRAFLSSGAQSVLGTLWQANPTAIDKLLVALCEAHHKTSSWVAALRQAQLAILDGSDPLFTLTYQTGLDGAHPWFWAPYQLIGRWR